MARTGYDVVVNDLPGDDSADETLAGIRQLGRQAAFVGGDIADTESHLDLVERAFSAFGTVDCLVNNAGVQVKVRGDMLDVDTADYDRVMGVNLRGTFFLTQKVALRMISENRTQADPRRSIVSISSVVTRAFQPQLAAYGLSKAGVSELTKMLAVRLAPHEIYVLEVRPGVIRSDMSTQIEAKYDRTFAQTNVVPLKRWGLGEEVGRAVASLASGAIPFCTGDGLNIDGGFHLHHFDPE